MDMAERTGIPKRTLDKYLLREGASLPGFDALCAMSKGLGVSLDWLVLGADFASEGVNLLAERSAYEIVKMMAQTILKYQVDGKVDLFDQGLLLNMDPEEWGYALGFEAGEFASKLVREGVTKSDLLIWREGRKQRAIERIQDRLEALKAGTLKLQQFS
jgi:transcriptional regulator with XRE-family HTH domain